MISVQIKFKVGSTFKKLTFFQNETFSFLVFKKCFLSKNPAAIAMNNVLQKYQTRFFPKNLTVNLLYAFATKGKKPMKGISSSLDENDFDASLEKILKSKSFDTEMAALCNIINQTNVSFSERFFPFDFNFGDDFKQTTFVELDKYLFVCKKLNLPEYNENMCLKDFYLNFSRRKNLTKLNLSDIITDINSNINQAQNKIDSEISFLIKKIINLEKEKETIIPALELKRTIAIQTFTNNDKINKFIFS